MSSVAPAFRVVPRTNHPADASRAPSAWPRQPQPTISARAKPAREESWTSSA
jgi:hypothetical protein